MVVENHHSLANELPEYLQSFVDYTRGWSASGQTARVARRFALVAAAGELATVYGLSGWERGAAQACRHFLRNLPGHPSLRKGQKKATSMPPAALAVLVPLDFDPPSGLKIYAPQ